MTAHLIECPEPVKDLTSDDVATSTGLFDLHPASTRAALKFAAGEFKTVRVGDTLWLAGGGYVTVEKVTKALAWTTGGKFSRATGCRWHSWRGESFVVAYRTRS